MPGPPAGNIRSRALKLLTLQWTIWQSALFKMKGGGGGGVGGVSFVQTEMSSSDGSLLFSNRSGSLGTGSELLGPSLVLSDK